MHFCFLALDYPTPSGGGGVGNQAQLVGRDLVRRGHAVSVITLMDSSGRPYWTDNGVEVYAAAFGSWHWYLSRLPGIGRVLGLVVRELEYSLAAWRTFKKINAKKPVDLVEGSETGCLLPSFCLKKIPLIIRLHGEVYSFHKHTPGLGLTMDLRLTRWLQRMAIRRADALVSPSDRHAREVREEIRLVNKEIHVIPNAIDLNAFPDALLYDCQEKSPLILFSGRLEKRKGVDLLLKAASQVVAAIPDVRFVLAGGNHISLKQSTLDRFVSENHLEDHVHFLGHVPWEQLLEIYRKASLFALPSFYETFGIVALEAMATGTPVVGWRSGALPEIIHDGITGILAAPGDVKRLADAMVTLLQDQDKRTAMGMAARERAADYDISKIALENLSLYHKVLGHV
jgi:glycosyltransferase involved in cell wall biosynthesis